jgi:PAS domain S-box-containing protein
MSSLPTVRSSFHTSARGRVLFLVLLVVLPTLFVEFFSEWLGWLRPSILTFILIVGLILAWVGSENLLLRPLRHLMAVVEQVQLGNLNARAAPGGYGLDEITTLAQAFNRMAAAIQQRELARKQAQSEREESDERFRAVFDNAAVGVAVMTLERKILQVNQAVTRLTGYSADELINQDPLLISLAEDSEQDRLLFAGLVDGLRDQITLEKRYLRKDGRIFWGRVNFSAVRSVEGRALYIIGMMEDITEQKRSAEKLAAQDAEYRRQLEQRVQERTEELNKANQLLQQKAAQDAVIAERNRLARELHDAVTQTLFSATLIAEIIPELWEKDPAEARRRLTELHHLSRGALAEMRTLLVELRPNALIEVPLPSLLRQLVEAYSGQSRIRIDLNIDGSRKLPPDVQVAAYRIAQEALNNVIKHSQAAEAYLTLRLGDVVRLVIVDNGAGFDPLTVTADHLGLKIMRERAEAIGAKLTVYSEPGDGTQISLSWQEGTQDGRE